MTNLEFINIVKNSKSVGDICSELQINYSNVTHGVSSATNEQLVVDKIKEEIIKLYNLLEVYEKEKIKDGE